MITTRKLDCSSEARETKGPARKKEAVGWSRNDGYVVIKIDGKKEYAHRIAWVFAHGSIDESLSIDHIDNNPANNAIGTCALLISNKINMNRSKKPKERIRSNGRFLGETCKQMGGTD